MPKLVNLSTKSNSQSSSHAKRLANQWLVWLVAALQRRSEARLQRHQHIVQLVVVGLVQEAPNNNAVDVLMLM